MGYGESSLGTLVRAYRQEAGMTQRELAIRTGLSVGALRDIEQSRRRRPRSSSLTALADAFNLDPSQAANLLTAGCEQRQSRRVRKGGQARPRYPEGHAEGLWVSALGPLEVWRDGTSLSLGPPSRRVVLGLLLLQPNAPVRRATMIDVLWGEAPPRTAVGLVQAHVSRLRKVLECPPLSASGGGQIDSAGGTYRLRLSGNELDLLAFSKLSERAAAARAGGDDVAACDFYEQAIGLWRSDPLADLDPISGHPGITMLRQQLTHVLLRYADVACALGLYSRAIQRLLAVSAAEPLNESAHARLMLALAASGQQAAAISVYEDLRARLNRELGLYPGEELADAHRRVLHQDIRTQRVAPAYLLEPAAGAAVVPRQLPAAPRCFVGRSGELSALSGLLEGQREHTSGVVIAALTGMAGIGKTALAVTWAHHVADQFPDGQLFINMRGFSPAGTPVTPTEAICSFLTALGVPASRIPADQMSAAALYRSLIAGRRMLVVLDNACDAEQVRSLLPGSPGCLVVVTSRNRLTGLAAAEGANLLPLGLLSEEESRELLHRNLDIERPAEFETISELARLCARLPLALCDVAARAAARPGLPLAGLAAEMRDWRVLDALETGESATSVRMAFSWSHARLGAEAALMFRLLGVYSGPDITVPAAVSLTGMTRNQAHLALAELCDGYLVTEHAPGRYTCHDLLRAYAAEGDRSCGSDDEQREAVHRVLDHYLHTVNAVSALLYQDYPQLTLDRPRPGVRPEEIVDGRRAMEWVENARHVVLAAIIQAASGGYAPHAWELPWAAAPFFTSKVPWARLALALASVPATARERGDHAGEAMAYYNLGLANHWIGDHGTACRYLDSAIELAGKLADGRLHALAVLARSRVLPVQARSPENGDAGSRIAAPAPCGADRSQ